MKGVRLKTKELPFLSLILGIFLLLASLLLASCTALGMFGLISIIP